MNTTIKLASAVAVVLLLAGLNGCGTELAPIKQGIDATANSHVVNGNVHGGQQPVSGASVQIYAVGKTGAQSASTLLNTAGVISDQNGNFHLTGVWNCTSNTAVYDTDPLVYVVATQGNPGLGAGVNNPAIAMITAIGRCSVLTPNSFITINERTTVAAIYALAPFMADVAHIGGQGTAPVGLANAFDHAAALANFTTGLIPGPILPANATAPLQEINSLADLIATCINSSGADALCSTLFAATTQTGGSVPANTISALLNIARNPSGKVAALFNMISPTAPFQPGLMATPKDWTIALNFTGGGLNAPAGIAIDASGNAWIANAGGNSVTELSSIGVPLTGSDGYTGNNTIFGAQALAIDRVGNVWIADTLLSTVIELVVGGGAVQSSTSFTNGGINGPTGIAIDSRNNIWVSNFAGGSVTELDKTGAAIGSSPLTGGGVLQAPLGIAIDSGGNAWVSDNAASVATVFSNNQALLSGTGYTDGLLLAPAGIALDISGRAWIAGSGNNAVSLLDIAGVASSVSPVGGVAMPSAIALDGAGTAWVVNNETSGSLAKLSAGANLPLSSSSGWGVLNAPMAIAVDASGSVWTANSGDNSVSEFIGLATPAIVPLAASVGP